MTPSPAPGPQWEFVVWSEEGRDGYSVCLHRGDVLSKDHMCVGYRPTKQEAEAVVAKANATLERILAEARAAALADAVALIQRRLVYDSQRAVSWHEIQDCLDALRAQAGRG